MCLECVLALLEIMEFSTIPALTGPARMGRAFWQDEHLQPSLAGFPSRCRKKTFYSRTDCIKVRQLTKLTLANYSTYQSYCLRYDSCNSHDRI
jgi:hypothetical protein